MCLVKFNNLSLYLAIFHLQNRPNLLCFIIGSINAEVDQIQREDKDVLEQDNIGVPDPDIIVVPDQDDIAVPDQDDIVVADPASVVLTKYLEQGNLNGQEKSEGKNPQSKRFGQIQNVQERLL